MLQEKTVKSRLYIAQYARYDNLPCVAGMWSTRNWWQGYDFRKQVIDYQQFGMKQNASAIWFVIRFCSFGLLKAKDFVFIRRILLRTANPKFKQRFSDGTLATLQIFSSRSAGRNHMETALLF